MKRATKTEQKVAVLTQGYALRRSRLVESIIAKGEELRNIEMDTGNHL
jgi:hypothetical protein